MKKIFLLLISFLYLNKLYSKNTNNYFRSLEIISSEGFCIPVDKDNKLVRDTSTFKHTNGIKLNLKNFTGLFSVGMDSTDIKTIFETNREELLSMQKYSWGISGNLNTEILKLDLFAGKLKFSQGISRLKTPWYSCPSPLKHPSVLTPGIAPGLSSSGADKPSAFSTIITPVGRFKFLPVIQTAVLDNNEKYLSIYKRTSIPFVPYIVFSTTAGLFIHNNENTRNWFQKSKYYRKNDYLSSETNLSLSWKYFITSTAIGIYENPFGGIENWIRNQSFILIKNFTLGLYTYKSDEGLITASGTETKTKEQLFITPQLRIPISFGTIETGISAGISRKKTNDRLPMNYDLYSGKFSIALMSKKISLKADSEIEYSTKDFLPDYSFQTQITIPVGKHSVKSTFYYSNQNKTKKTYKIEESLILRKQLLESIQMKLTTTENEKNKKWDFESIAKFSRTTKRFKWSIKLDFLFRKKS